MRGRGEGGGGRGEGREREREGGREGERKGREKERKKTIYYSPRKTLNHIRHYAEEGLFDSHGTTTYYVQVMHNVIITIVLTYCPTLLSL